MAIKSISVRFDERQRRFLREQAAAQMGSAAQVVRQAVATMIAAAQQSAPRPARKPAPRRAAK